MTSDLHNDLRDPDPQLEIPNSVLAIGAHPDDIEFGAGATLARWVTAGTAVAFVIVTDGSKGTWDPTRDPADLATQRREEQAAAAGIIGARTVEHLDHVDGELEYSMELRSVMAALVRRHRASVVITHDPWQRYQLHPDHRTTGLAVVDGVVAARDPLFFPDHGLDHHRPDALLLWSADEPDHVEPTTAAALDTKVAALLCHSSQAETTMGAASSKPQERAAFAARIEAGASRAGAPFGVGNAEVFKRLTP